MNRAALNNNKRQPGSFKLLVVLLKDYIKNHKLGFFVAFFCILINSCGTIVAPLMLQRVINSVNTGIGPVAGVGEAFEASIASISKDVLFLGIAYIIALCGGFSYGQITATIGQTYMHELRQKVYNHMQDLPIKYFDTHDKGDIMSLYTNDIDTIRQLIIDAIPTALICFFNILSIITIMLLSSVVIFAVVILGTVAMFFVVKSIGGKSSKYFIAQQRQVGVYEGYIEEMMSGLKVTKSFCHEEESKIKFDGINKNLSDTATSANKYSNILMPIMGNIGNLLYVLAAFVGTIWFIKDLPNLTITGIGSISIGVVTSFLPMIRQYTNSVAQMSNQVNAIAMSIGGSARIASILSEPVEVDDGFVTLVRAKKDSHGVLIECPQDEATTWAWRYPHSSGEVTLTELMGDIRMKDVDFAYEEGKVVLHDVTLYAEPGQKVAFVGATGAGKTTITNLINRFYDIADGKVRYDGININKIKKKDLRKSLAMVLQDTNLFTGTIMDNIRYGRLEATDEECIEAAKLANADSFISRLPHGYNTMLKSDGANLSQGQRQLLSIARAAVSGAPVMILDEATSSIDTRTESLVTKAMDNLMNGRTTFVIAHRLSTIQNADVIMVLDHGRIIERGSHDDLIKAQGMYYQLYTGAFELE